MSMTAVFVHNDCERHEVPPRHPESPSRIQAVWDRFNESGLLDEVEIRSPEIGSFDDLARVHTPSHIDFLREISPSAGLVRLDFDTAMGPTTLAAARRAAGAAVSAVKSAIEGEHLRSFCLVRPPGHHAERNDFMGFCLFNSIAVAADVALDHVERVAILDFDVHHGNGTVEIFADRTEVLVCSSFQYPQYPYRFQEFEAPNIVNTPLPEGTAGHAFRKAIERDWIPAVEKHKPDLILVSAGFDAHRDDPFAGLNLVEEDYQWVTELILELAKATAQGRIVSTLEGGYELNALARSAEVHLATLL